MAVPKKRKRPPKPLTVGDRNPDHRASRRVLQRQSSDALSGYQERQAQSPQTQQRPSDQARRSPGMVRGVSRDSSRQGDDERLEGIPDVYLVWTFDLLYDSASSAVPQPDRTDAAMDVPCLYSTLSRRLRQFRCRGSPIPLHLTTAIMHSLRPLLPWSTSDSPVIVSDGSSTANRGLRTTAQ